MTPDLSDNQQGHLGGQMMCDQLSSKKAAKEKD